MEEKRVPELRFPEFQIPWNHSTIGAIADVIGGGTPDTNNSLFWNGEINWFTPSEVGKSKYITESIRKISKDGLKISSAKLLPIGAILFTSRATIGEVSITRKESTTNQGFQSLVVYKQNEKEFIYYLLITLKNEFFKKACGSTFLEIGANAIKRISIYIPGRDEQQKIADFLSAVDRKIDLLEKQLELQKQYKRGIMQRIFSQKIRFRDDEGNQYPEWEETELSEVVERITTRNEEGNDNVLTISAQMGLVNQLLYYNRSVASKDLSNYYLLNKGDFAYNKSYSAGYPLGAFKRLDKYTKGVVSPLYICFRPQGNIDSDYLIHYFEAGMMNDPIQSIAQEGARNHGLLNVGVKDFFSLDLLCPPIEEQKKIADFLNSLDEKIEITKTQIEKAKIWKKGLLQQMFV